MTYAIRIALLFTLASTTAAHAAEDAAAGAEKARTVACKTMFKVRKKAGLIY